jgi:hypothetical protein
VYTTDFTSFVVPFSAKDPDSQSAEIEEHVIQTFRQFSSDHMCKFVGAGVTIALLKEAPNLCTRLWLELDIVPITFNIRAYQTDENRPNLKSRASHLGAASASASGAQTPAFMVDPKQFPKGYFGAGGEGGNDVALPRTVDEQADSAARKALMYFGPNGPRLEIGPRNQVAVDAGFKIHLIDDLDEYKKSCGKGTWNAVTKMAEELREKKVKMGFFSSTPQGGGVALVRAQGTRHTTEC